MTTAAEWQKNAREAESKLIPEEVWGAIFGDPQLGAQVRTLLLLLGNIDKAKLVGACSWALQEITRLETIGPLFDPSAWNDGTRIENARRYKDILRKLSALRDALPL